MELRQLQYFHAVVRHGGFTRAAEALHVAQPAISAQIRQLEKELGTELLQRTTRRVSLTHAGELFAERVQRILDQLDGARADLADLAGVLRGRVRVGATAVLGTVDLAATMTGFRVRYPGVGIALRTGLIAPLLHQLDEGQIDMVVGPVPHDLAERYAGQELVHERLVVVAPPSHPLTVNGKHTLADFAADSFVCLPEGSGLHGILTRAATRAGFVPKIEFETYSPVSIREMVAAGLGVALLAHSTAASAGPPLKLHRLDPAPPHPPIGLITSREKSIPPAAQAFCDHLVESVGAP